LKFQQGSLVAALNVLKHPPGIRTSHHIVYLSNEMGRWMLPQILKTYSWKFPI